MTELLRSADAILSRLEADRDAARMERAPQRLLAAVDAVWAAAARYLLVVDNLQTEGHEEVVRTAAHTALLGAEEATQALEVLRAAQAGEVRPQHVRFLRLWLERLRETAGKARDPA